MESCAASRGREGDDGLVTGEATVRVKTGTLLGVVGVLGVVGRLAGTGD